MPSREIITLGSAGGSAGRLPSFSVMENHAGFGDGKIRGR